MSDDAKALTLTEAARLARRSYSWARNRAADGRFDLSAPDGRRIMVTARSVAKAIEGDRLSRRQATRRPRTSIRLVVDNTK